MSPLKNKLKAKARGENRRREAVTVAIADILSRGEPTKFAYEAACRHGLRSRLCLDGSPWPAADRFAGTVVEEALRLLGAERPTWAEGQPEHTTEGFAPIARTRCIRCGAPLPDTWSPIPRKYCSRLCSDAASEEKVRLSGERMTRAEFAAAQAARADKNRRAREHTCEHCGKPFFRERGKAAAKQKYCSHACYSATLSARPRKTYPPRPCAECGKEFAGGNATALYCSPACAAVADRRKRQAARASRRTR